MQEPKSIHTWFQPDRNDLVGYEVDVCISEFGSRIPSNWLYYFALQVNFVDHDEWAHGGIQFAGCQEFRGTNGLGVNWGGGGKYTTDGGIGRTNTPFRWKPGVWYRYRVWQADNGSDGRFHWGFSIIDYSDGIERDYGRVRTISNRIRIGMVFTETGYGVGCESERVCVEWRNPLLRTLDGQEQPSILLAGFNGTCGDPCSTDQRIVEASPLRWIHETNTPRYCLPNTDLLSKVESSSLTTPPR